MLSRTEPKAERVRNRQWTKKRPKLIVSPRAKYIFKVMPDIGEETSLRHILGGRGRSDFVRIILQALRENGFERSAEMLREESNIELESSEVATFKEAILNGDYTMALGLLGSLSPDLSETTMNRIKFEIARERYLELLEERQIKAALGFLREAITPNAAEPKDVHSLASLIAYSGNNGAIHEKAQWHGRGRASRDLLLEKIHCLLPKGLMMQPGRIGQLFQQAFAYQRSQCRGHVRSPPLSLEAEDGLLADHRCSRDAFVLTNRLRIAKAHTDEVWFCAFSPDGRRLASASKDSSVMIWSVPEGALVYALKEHAAGVVHLAWSPDGQTLLTCSLDSRARLWDLRTGQCVRIFLLNGEATAGVWCRSGDAVIIASQDGTLNRFARDGTASTKRPLRCLDVAVLSDGRIGGLDAEMCMHLLSSDTLQTFKSWRISDPDGPATSFRFSRDAKQLFFTEINPSTITKWVLKEGETGSAAVAEAEAEAEAEEKEEDDDNDDQGEKDFSGGKGREVYECDCSYMGHVDSRFLIRACLMRPDEGLIAVGSEDGQIIVYEVDMPFEVLLRVDAHTDTVNCVDWTDAHGGLLASVSDDQSICLWSLDNSPL